MGGEQFAAQAKNACEGTYQVTVALYMDVHIPRAITVQLRLSGVDVLTAQEDGHAEVDDTILLNRATELGRVLFTQDKGVIESATNQRIRWPYPLASPGLPPTDKTAAIR